MATTYKRNNTFKPINDSTEITYTKGLAPSGSVNLAGVVTPTYGDLLGNATPSNSSMIPGVSYSSALNPNYVDPNKVTNTNIANPNLNSFSAPMVTMPKYEQVITPFEGESVTGDTGETGEGGETGGEIVDTGSTGGDGGETGGEGGNGTPTSTLPPSYEEYILSMKSNADDAYKQSILDAETARQKAVNDARNAYDKSVSGYGANAEALRSMGLVGSGYSDYLDASAYAQMRDDVLAAHNTKQQAVSSAEALKDQQYAQYDGLYADYLNGVETNRIKAYNDIYSNIANYSVSDIEILGSNNNLTPEQITELKRARGNAVYNTFKNSSYTQEQLDQYKTELDPTQYEELSKNVVKPEDLVNATYTTEEGAAMSYNEARAQLSAILSSDVPQYEKDAWQKAFDESYGSKLVYTGGIVKYGDVGSKFKGDKDGDNFKVEVGGEKYKLENGGKQAEESNVVQAVKAASPAIADNELFIYDGELYMKYNGEIYKVRGRGNTAGDYNAVVAIITNNAKK